MKKKNNWLTEREAAKALRKKGKALTILADGKTSNGNKRWSKKLLKKLLGG